MTTIKATLVFELEYDEDEVEADPKELLLEILADQSDAYLIDLINITRTETL
jgi:hypothetical protein